MSAVINSVPVQATNVTATSVAKGVSASTLPLSSKETLGKAVANGVASLLAAKPAIGGVNSQAIVNDGSSIGSPQGQSLIAIMAEVMTLQGQCNSNFWDTLWQQASDNMMMCMQLAPVVANATAQSWNAQADISRNEAKMSDAMGAVDISTFVLSVGVGAYAGFSEEMEATEEKPTNPNAEDPTTLTRDEEAAGEETSNEQANLKKTESAESKAVSENANEGGQSTKSTFKKTLSKIGEAFKKGSPVLKSLTKAAMYSQLFSQLAQGSSAFIQATYKNKIAADQQLAGAWQAVEKEGDIDVQFYQQAFSRTNGVMEGSQQNIDTAMNILSQVANQITSTVNSGFQKI